MMNKPPNQKEFKAARQLLAVVFLSSVFSFLGIAIGIELFKYIASILQIVLIIYSLNIFYQYRFLVDWNKALFFLMLFSIYPLFRITLDNVEAPSFKSITDGFIANGSYYQLAISGLAFAILSKRIDVLPVFSNFAFVSALLGFGLMVLSMKAVGGTKIGLGHLAIVNCFVPGALLSLQERNKRYMIFGFISILLVLFVSSRIWSRSYSLVGFYLATLAIYTQFRSGNRRLAYTIVLFSLVSYAIGLFSFFTEVSEISDASVADKYQFASLLDSINQFFRDGDIVKLYYWEGNSRADILVDAFKDFTLSEWIFGRGIYGTYISFVERHTIEIGWIQELFNWGIPYLLLAIYAFFRAFKRLKGFMRHSNDPLLQMLSVLILIKFLDSFVFGMPQFSVYNFLVFWGIAKVCVRSDSFSTALNNRVRYVQCY